MKDKQEAALKAINLQLESIKVILNTFWEEKDQFTLQIEDKYTNEETANDPTEDIELKIKSIRLSRKS